MFLRSIIWGLAALTVFLSPLPATIFKVYPLYFVLFLCVGFFSLKVAMGGTVRKEFFYSIILYVSPSLISLFVSLPVVLLLSNDYRFDYSGYFWFGRLINLIVLLIFFLVLVEAFKENGAVYHKILKCYWWAVAVLLASALYQLLSLYIDFFPFPFETRSWVHSAIGQYGIKARLTGFAEEPSYLVPFAVDFIAISMIIYGVNIKFLICFMISVLVLLFSFSPSGYILFLFSSVFSLISVLIVKNFVVNRRLLFFAGIFLIFSGIAIPFLPVLDAFEYFKDRVYGFNPADSTRAFMNIMPFYWANEGGTSPVVQYLIGHGMKTYSLIGEFYTVPNGAPVHVTSNNYFVDIFWEAGLLGLFFSVLFFLRVFYLISLVKFSFVNTYAVFFLYFDVLFSMLFRAEFASPRSFVLLSFILFIATCWDYQTKDRNFEDFTK